MTIRHVHAVIHAMLGQAVKQGRVQRNVTDLVDAPERRTPGDDHADRRARALLSAASSDPLEALHVLALTTGMRCGELLALQRGTSTSTACRSRSAARSCARMAGSG
jgi:hypothetical protein